MYLLSCMLTLLVIITLAQFRSGRATVSTSLIIQWGCLTVFVYFLTVLSISGFFSNLLGSGYFGFVRSDSVRYINEANLFSADLLSINELAGTVGDYSATPKFGLSSLLAIYSAFLGELSPGAGLLLMNVTWIGLAGYYAYLINKILKVSAIGKVGQSLFILLLLFFPLDYYWNLLLLREPLANMLLLTSLTAGYYASLGKKSHYAIALTLCLALVLFRAQMGLLASASLIMILIASLDKGRRWRSLFPLILIFLLSFAQSFRSTGLVLLAGFLDSLGLNAISGQLRFFEYGVGLSTVLFLSVAVAAVASTSVPKSKSSTLRPKWYLIGSIALVVLFLSALLLGLQLRVIYPLFLLIKLYCLFFWSSRNLQRIAMYKKHDRVVGGRPNPPALSGSEIWSTRI